EAKLGIVRRAEQRRLRTDECKVLADKELVRAELAVALLQFRLGVEEIEMRRSPDEMNVEDAFGPRSMMGRRSRAGGFARLGFAEQQLGERDPPHALQQRPARYGGEIGD